MISIGVLYFANIGELSNSKNAAVNKVVHEEFKKILDEKSIQVSFNLDVDINFVRISTSFARNSSIDTKTVSEIVTLFANKVLNVLLVDSFEFLELSYTVTNDFKFNWSKHKNVLSDLDHIEYSGYRSAITEGKYLGDLTVHPDYTQRYSGDTIEDTFFQTVLRNKDLHKVNISNIDFITNEINGMISLSEMLYKGTKKRLEDDTDATS